MTPLFFAFSKKKLTSIFLIGLGVLALQSSANAGPRQRIAFLISIPQVQVLQPLSTVRHVRDQFEPQGYEVWIQSQADQFDLWRELHDGRNVAVFWLAHAGRSESLRPGLLTCSNVLQDSLGRDVSHVLREVHPNLRVLAMIGCYSESILRNLDFEQKLTESHPHLKLFGSSEGVKYLAQMDFVIQKSLEYLNTPSIREGYRSSVLRRRGLLIRIRRGVDTPRDLSVPEGSEYLAAAAIETPEKLITVLPPQRASRSFFKAYLPLDLSLPAIRKSNFRLFLTRGIIPAAYFNSNIENKREGLGKLEIQVPWSGNWERFESSSGQPVGLSRHIYNYDGPLELESFMQDYSAFQEVDIPPLTPPD